MPSNNSPRNGRAQPPVNGQAGPNHQQLPVNAPTGPRTQTENMSGNGTVGNNGGQQKHQRWVPPTNVNGQVAHNNGQSPHQQHTWSLLANGAGPVVHHGSQERHLPLPTSTDSDREFRLELGRRWVKCARVNRHPLDRPQDKRYEFWTEKPWLLDILRADDHQEAVNTMPVYPPGNPQHEESLKRKSEAQAMLKERTRRLGILFRPEWKFHTKTFPYLELDILLELAPEFWTGDTVFDRFNWHCLKLDIKFRGLEYLSEFAREMQGTTLKASRIPCNDNVLLPGTTQEVFGNGESSRNRVQNAEAGPSTKVLNEWREGLERRERSLGQSVAKLEEDKRVQNEFVNKILKQMEEVERKEMDLKREREDVELQKKRVEQREKSFAEQQRKDEQSLHSFCLRASADWDRTESSQEIIQQRLGRRDSNLYTPQVLQTGIYNSVFAHNLCHDTQGRDNSRTCFHSSNQAVNPLTDPFPPRPGSIRPPPGFEGVRPNGHPYHPRSPPPLYAACTGTNSASRICNDDSTTPVPTASAPHYPVSLPPRLTASVSTTRALAAQFPLTLPPVPRPDTPAPFTRSARTQTSQPQASAALAPIGSERRRGLGHSDPTTQQSASSRSKSYEKKSTWRK